MELAYLILLILSATLFLTMVFFVIYEPIEIIGSLIEYKSELKKLKSIKDSLNIK